MVDTEKPLNWSKVSIPEGLHTINQLIEHTNKSVELLEQMAMLFRVAETFPDIAEENKKFTLLREQHSLTRKYALIVEGHERKLTRKQHDYIVKGKPYENDAATHQRSSKNYSRGAAPH